MARTAQSNVIALNRHGIVSDELINGQAVNELQ